MKERNHITKWLYWFTLGIAFIAVYKMLDNFTAIGTFFANLIGVLMPFIMGGLIAFILYIPCKKVENVLRIGKAKHPNKVSRVLAILIVYVIIVLLLTILITCILPPIINSIADLATQIPSYYNKIMQTLNDLPDDSIFVEFGIREQVGKISSIKISQYLQPEYIIDYLKGAMSVANNILNVFVTFIISIYTLAERERIMRFFRRFITALWGTEAASTVSKYFRKSNEIFYRFISGQLIDAILVGVLTSIAMSILRVKCAILLGFLIGLFNMIPFFGAIVAVCIAIIITFCTGGLGKAIWLAIIVIIIQQIDANIINPKIMSNKLNISPILVISSVALPGAYFGVLGMFLAVPVATVLKVMIDDYIESKEKKI